MLGETTLAMLYVPLFFYIFDRIKERREKPQAATGAAATAAPHARREGD
jgi:multidrug efflux pump